MKCHIIQRCYCLVSNYDAYKLLTFHDTAVYLGPVWLDKKPKPKLVSKSFAFAWIRISETESGFVKPWHQPRRQIHWLQDGERRWASVSGIFRQFVLSIQNPKYDNKTPRKVKYEILIKFVWIRLINSDILMKTRSRFCICFQETEMAFGLFTTSWFQDPDVKIQIC